MAGETKNLCMTGAASALHAAPYAGDVNPKEAYAALAAQPGVLVDVRTPEEWQQGQPDVSATPSAMVSISLKTLPDYALNPNFIDMLVKSKGVDRNTPLYFMCKGGGRSQEAATMLAALGYKHCFNIRGGFEGKPDSPGWKTNQLPWKKG